MHERVKLLAPTCEGVPLNKISGVYCSSSKYAGSGGVRILSSYELLGCKYPKR